MSGNEADLHVESLVTVTENDRDVQLADQFSCNPECVESNLKCFPSLSFSESLAESQDYDITCIEVVPSLLKSLTLANIESTPKEEINIDSVLKPNMNDTREVECEYAFGKKDMISR